MAFVNGSDPHDASTWRGRWCWTARRVPRPWNTYACFRKAVELSGRPTRAVVRISADARYTLYVNGRRIHHGPARSFPGRQSFDTLDLADHLDFGTNVIAAVVHQFGTPTSLARYRDASGFVLDGVVELDGADEPVPLHTPEGWLVRDARGWRQDVARVSADLGFQEHFDADADPVSWLTHDYAATEADGWKAPVVVAPVGGHPWVTMEPRGVPPLADEVQAFESIVAQFGGENARGYKVATDVYGAVLQEQRRKAKALLEGPDAMLRDDDQSTTLAPPPDGQFHMVVLDLGTIRTAHLILDLADAAGDEIIDVLYSDRLDKSSAPPPADAQYAPGDRYRCRPGPQRWEPFCPKGFRYASLIFRNVEQPLKIRHVGARVVRAALEQVGAFECSDATLNGIYNAATQTLRACCLDALVDSPGRSQAQRWPHARITARALAYAFGDVSLLERGIRQLAQSQAADGSLHSHPPADDPRGRSVDAALAWIEAIWDHHFHTGRTDLLRCSTATLADVLRFFEGHETSGGVIGDFTGFDLLLDAREVPLHRDDCSGPLNLLYLRALRRASAIYDVLGLEAEATRSTHKADALAKSLNERLWDAKAKGWKDGIALPGGEVSKDHPPTVNQLSVHASALAVLLKLKPETDQAVARDVIFRAMRTRRTKTVSPLPLFAGDALAALVEAGLRGEAIDLIRAKWGPMVADGSRTLWEDWDGSGSRCFAPSAAPLYVLVQQVLGVTPVEAGWKRVRIAPLVGSLEFARGVVPCPLGPVQVEWEKVAEDQLAVRVDLPDAVEGQFVGPLGETRDLASGVSEFHT